MRTPGQTPAARPWRSLKLRLLLVFVLLAVASTVVFVGGARRAFTVGFADTARPLLSDYVDRLAAEVAGGATHAGPAAPTAAGTPDAPAAAVGTRQALGADSIARAQALAQRLPLVVRISGPVVNWSSQPDGHAPPPWRQRGPDPDTDPTGDPASEFGDGDHDARRRWDALLSRRTADGHLIRFDLDRGAALRRPGALGHALAALLVLTLLAWGLVRWLLKPLDAIGAGARRFGRGDFAHPITPAQLGGTTELRQLGGTLNAMGRDIHQMLEAKRALLLAISHELRSPLTRARLNTELLPETPELAPQREALLRDLQDMARLVSDLLESERLAGAHAALQREPTDLAALARGVLDELAARHADAAQVQLHLPPGPLPLAQVDPARLRLLLRNLLDNALRHGAGAPQPPELHLRVQPDAWSLVVRDHGPGVADAQLDRLAQAFYRPDSARSRAAGGVGLGLYLCRLVAQAHGGRLQLQPARPGLAVHVTLPRPPT